MNFFKLALILIMSICSLNAAMNLQLEEDIYFKEKRGSIHAKTTHGKHAFNAIGSYIVSSKTYKVLIRIDRLESGGKIYYLKQQPSIIRQLKNPNARLPKGATIIVRGENYEELKHFTNMLSDQEIIAQGEADEKKKTTKSIRSIMGSGGNASANGSASGAGIGTSSGTTTTNFPYIPTGTTTIDKDGNATTTYSNQYCKVPEFDQFENIIRLSIVDKDGNCVDRLALRDDTKCEYRLDFANNKAIKQTQYYYVDNENKMQNVGDCVDLKGAEYQAEIYQDDTRCSLEHTNKDYGGGTGSFFTTQLLYRGIDGLIHEATDCIAYGNVKEELVSYKHDEKARQSQRIINQYYTDPYTNEQKYIAMGKLSDKNYAWKEETCGDWENDDENLKAKKRTEVNFYDEIDGKKQQITSCDYSSGIGLDGVTGTNLKTSAFEVNYQKINNVNKENVIKEVELKNINLYASKYSNMSWRKWCTDFCATPWKKEKSEQNNTANNSPAGTTNLDIVFQLRDKTNYDSYIRPDGSIYNKPIGQNQLSQKMVDLVLIKRKDDHKLNEDWFKMWAVSSGKLPFTDEPDIQAWLNSNTFKQELNKWETAKKHKTCADPNLNGELKNANCSIWGDYILTN